MINFDAAVTVTAETNTARRTIAGVIGYVEMLANGGTGPFILDNGAIEVPEDLSRVKLLASHDHSKPLGYCLSYEQRGRALYASFRVAPGPAGDAALEAAAAKTIDGLSVGLEIIEGEYDGAGRMCVHKAKMREVSLVTIPAFSDAHVTNVQAALAQDERNIMETVTDDSKSTTTEATEAEATEAAPAAAVEAAAPAPQALTAGILATPGKARRREASIVEAASAVAAAVRADAGASGVIAALQDITVDMDKGQGYFRPAWLGELWQARTIERPLIDSLTQRALPNALKVYGWQWDARPTVDTYAGKKTEIPSSTASTKMLEANVEMIAGGWDIERRFIDLGGADMVEALWRAAVDDYAAKTEAAALTKVKAAATPVDAGANLAATLVTLGAKAAEGAFNLDWVMVAPDVWAQLTAMTKDNLPWWLLNSSISITSQTQNVSGVRIRVAPTLAKGEVLAGDKRAATWFEKTPPVKVQAIDLPRGGIDLALHGYHAMLVNEPKALLKVTAKA